MPLLRIFNIADMSFKAICENRILAKIYEFTVLSAYLINYMLLLAHVYLNGVSVTYHLGPLNLLRFY